MRHAAVAAFLLHLAAALWVWNTWSGFGRGNVLVWMDFPSSLAFLQLRGRWLLAGSVLVGGLEWAVVAGLLTYFLGRSARR